MIVVFRADDLQGRTVLLVLSGTAPAARSEDKKQPQAPPLTLKLSYNPRRCASRHIPNCQRPVVRPEIQCGKDLVVREELRSRWGGWRRGGGVSNRFCRKRRRRSQFSCDMGFPFGGICAMGWRVISVGGRAASVPPRTHVRARARGKPRLVRLRPTDRLIRGKPGSVQGGRTSATLDRPLAIASAANRKASVMYGSELRTCGLGAVVCVLLGAGIGFGWHYFADSAGAAVVASAATPPAKQDVPNPRLSNSPPQREGPVLDVPGIPGLSNYRQPAQSSPRCCKTCTKGRACEKHQPNGLIATSRQP
jgi:hypothetical protein